MCHMVKNSAPATARTNQVRSMWSKYLGEYVNKGETRNGAPIYVLDVPKAWWEAAPPPQATFSKHKDGNWYVQSAAEENQGTIFKSKICIINIHILSQYSLISFAIFYGKTHSIFKGLKIRQLWGFVQCHICLRSIPLDPNIVCLIIRCIC